jgi:methionine sulfoxide reductase catalytic subunit
MVHLLCLLPIGFLILIVAVAEFVADLPAIGGSYGGYNQGHEFFEYRQSI